MGKNKRKGSRRKIGIGIAVAVVVILLVCVGGAGMMFQEELKIIGTVKTVMAAEHKNIYYMEIESDYHFDEFLEAGGASSDEEVGAFLSKCISKGFYSVEVKNDGPSCSVISAETPEGEHIWGRNFDWYGSVPIIVKCTPEDGYASIATCDLQNITNSTEIVPESFVNKMLAIASLYVPMDGINEAGLCVADLEVNEGGMIAVNTEKPDLTVTTAIRLLLNKAATVEEAVAYLQQYDIHASGGISHHLAISDASGASVAVEFVNGEATVVETNCVTNFNLAGGDIAAGGESSQQRYETLCAVYEENGGVLTKEQVRDALAQVGQTEGKWTTQWSVIYGEEGSVAYYFDGNFENQLSVSWQDWVE